MVKLTPEWRHTDRTQSRTLSLNVLKWFTNLLISRQKWILNETLNWRCLQTFRSQFCELVNCRVNNSVSRSFCSSELYMSNRTSPDNWQVRKSQRLGQLRLPLSKDRRRSCTTTALYGINRVCHWYLGNQAHNHQLFYCIHCVIEIIWHFSAHCLIYLPN